jgi:hypothetical protein
MARGFRARVAVAGFLALSGCGGGGGSGIDAGPGYWAIPLVPADATRTMTVFLRNLSTSGATATLQGYEPDGTAYTGPVVVGLDGNDEHAISVSTALGGDAPAGGWIQVTTPSLAVEVAYLLFDGSKFGEEAVRAIPFPDLTAPPPTTTAGITVVPATSRIQIGNPTPGPIVVAVTAYAEPASDPLLPPVASTPAPIALAAFESKTLTPDAVAGIAGFVGALYFSSAAPFFVAAEEDLGIETVQAQVETRFMEVSTQFGTDSGFQFKDFVLLVRNDADESRTVSLNDVRDQDGSPLIVQPRQIILAPHESRAMTTTDVPFADLFGDVHDQAGLRQTSIGIAVPTGVAATFRQYDPDYFEFNSVLVPQTSGHVFETLGVFPEPSLPSPVSTSFTVVNPNGTQVTVDLSVRISQPDGFDAATKPWLTLVIQPHQSVDLSGLLDGTVFLNRDEVEESHVGLLATSAAPINLFGRRETRDGAGLLIMLSPVVIRNLEVGD